MTGSSSVPIIIAPKDSQSLESEGRIVYVHDGASINTIKTLAQEKLGFAVSVDQVVLEKQDGVEVNEIDVLKLERVIYVGIKEIIKDTIPGPMRLPVFGNLYSMMPDITAGWRRHFDTYGNLISINLLGEEMVGTNDPEIAELFVKESGYFTKKIFGFLQQVRDFSGNGLFTSDTDDKEWELAHKLLMPAFSPRAIKAYQTDMGNIAIETIKVLEKYSPNDKVDILTWCTNLTFETIGRVGFGYSFDLMDIDKPAHPFIDAMSYGLNNALYRALEPSILKKLPLNSNYKWEEGNHLMRSIVEQVIKERRASANVNDAPKDLLGYMLHACDENNLKLTDENIRDQVVTFLIAGHDTTANTLAWVLYELSQNPQVETEVLREIANAGISSDVLPTVEQISSLKYLDRLLKETLRLHPPLRAISKLCIKDCVVPGGYKIRKGQICAISIANMHTNPKVYPEPLIFNPDRFLPEEEQKRSRFSWLPFSTGPRACIGMAFALQEAKTALSMLLHRFKFCYDGPPISYDLNQTTTKPANFFVNILPRTDFPEAEDVAGKNDAKKSTHVTKMPTIDLGAVESSSLKLPKVTFLFGTQTGTSQDYAYQLSSQAKRFGFADITFCSMDQWSVISAENQPLQQTKTEDQLLIICTATYNGFPPDSAENFDRWISKQCELGNKKLLNGTSFTVFGVGNKNWRTYQAFPTKVDSCLEALGAKRCFPLGSGDVDGDSDADFSEWTAHFWTFILNNYGLSTSTDKLAVPSATLAGPQIQKKQVEVSPVSPSDIQKCKLAKENVNGTFNATIVGNMELQDLSSDRSTRHIEIDISKLKGLDKHPIYEPGNHIEIAPENTLADVEQVALGLKLDLDLVFEIDSNSTEGCSPRSLARVIQGPCTVRNALLYYADLLSPPSRTMVSYYSTQLNQMSAHTSDLLEGLKTFDESDQDFYSKFINKYRNLIELQSAFPQVCYMDFGHFLAAVHVMQPRRYSIASSPLIYPNSIHISVSVVDDIVNEKHYAGLSSSYLARSKIGEDLRLGFKSSRNTFSMPEDLTIPMIMIAAGTGIAPFRGFLQHRLMEKRSGKQVAPCLLFFGCRHPDKDHLYKKEIQDFIEFGILSNSYPAFSRVGSSASNRYVQHQILNNSDKVWDLMRSSAIYVCGAVAMSQEVRAAFRKIITSFDKTKSEEDAEVYLQALEAQKLYMSDVWG
ncbi:cytochrome P450 [Blakeslea trispora]|nr:cytochrome P450 [Blakeslea trispora]